VLGVFEAIGVADDFEAAATNGATGAPDPEQPDAKSAEHSTTSSEKRNGGKECSLSKSPPLIADIHSLPFNRNG
jgi:hypothetical protein